jgi:hypothetical protein
VQHASCKWGAPILEAPEEERRDQFLAPYFRRAQPDRIVAILKAREPACILLGIGKSCIEQEHLLYQPRRVDPTSSLLDLRSRLGPHVRAPLPGPDGV